tara:strand:- start:12410 stop:12535 length:126 start_codon:yes stop_codon:yes gene_type:complete
MTKSKMEGDQDAIIESLGKIRINININDDSSQGKSYTALSP